MEDANIGILMLSVPLILFISIMIKVEGFISTVVILVLSAAATAWMYKAVSLI